MGDRAGMLAGRHLLVVEDEYFLADDLTSRFREQGAVVVGPAANLGDALELLEGGEPIDCAVLDLNLQGEKAFPIADALMKRDVPFVFATGYDASAIPARFAGVKRCEKPVDAIEIARALLS